MVRAINFGAGIFGDLRAWPHFFGAVTPMEGSNRFIIRRMQYPPESVLAHLHVQLVGDLGGRHNRHWIVAGRDKLILRKWAGQPLEDIRYERTLVEGLAMLGWPVAPLCEPVIIEGKMWSLAPFLPGESPIAKHAHEPRARGRVLAELHSDMAQIEMPSHRTGWRRCEAILADPQIDRTLSENESVRPDEVHVVRWHLDRARRRVEGLRMETWPSIPIHGDFAPWNLLYEGDRLTGLLDFELSRNDHRVADFALSWRGQYDAVIEGYEEVAPLSPEERSAITPVWWAELIEGACRNMRHDRSDDGWTIKKLLCRSPMMGPDAEEMPRL